MTMDATIVVGCVATQSSTLDISKGIAPLSYLVTYAMRHGTDRDEATTFTSDERTLGNGATDAFDLAGGLVDSFGNTVTFTRLRAIFAQAPTTNTGALTLFTTGANQHLGPMLAGTITLAIGATFGVIDPSPDGMVVTAGTGDVLRITNTSGASQTYRIVLVGAT